MIFRLAAVGLTIGMLAGCAGIPSGPEPSLPVIDEPATRPARGTFYVGGQVRRAGAYRLTDRPVTLKEVAARAELFPGLSPDARTSLVRRRVGDGEPDRYDIGVRAILETPAGNMLIQPDDQLTFGTNYGTACIGHSRPVITLP